MKIRLSYSYIINSKNLFYKLLVRKRKKKVNQKITYLIDKDG